MFLYFGIFDYIKIMLWKNNKINGKNYIKLF